MNRHTAIAFGIGAALVAAVLVVVLLPAPDPLRGVRTVYLSTGVASDARGASELDAGLDVVLNDRNLTLVSDPAQADVELRIETVSVDLGDVTLSLGPGGIRGRVNAACRLIDSRSGRAYTMDLIVTVSGDAVTARLVARKFWEFWK